MTGSGGTPHPGTGSGQQPYEIPPSPATGGLPAKAIDARPRSRKAHACERRRVPGPGRQATPDTGSSNCPRQLTGYLAWPWLSRSWGSGPSAPDGGCPLPRHRSWSGSACTGVSPVLWWAVRCQKARADGQMLAGPQRTVSTAAAPGRVAVERVMTRSSSVGSTGSPAQDLCPYRLVRPPASVR